jgi:hypothetical protein
LADISNIIIAFLSGVIGPLIVVIVKYNLNKRKKPDVLVEAVNNANIINDEIERVLSEYTADRIWILQFHNGGNFYPTGKSIQKFSMIYEFVRLSKDTIRDNFQNIPVNLFSKALHKVLTDDYLSIPDYKDADAEIYGLKYFSDECRTKSSYLFGIRNLENRLIAVLGVEYTDRKKTLPVEEIIQLRVVAAQISGELSSHIK